jgi:hypothetical protein
VCGCKDRRVDRRVWQGYESVAGTGQEGVAGTGVRIGGVAGAEIGGCGRCKDKMARAWQVQG